MSNVTGNGVPGQFVVTCTQSSAGSGNGAAKDNGESSDGTPKSNQPPKDAANRIGVLLSRFAVRNYRPTNESESFGYTNANIAKRHEDGTNFPKLRHAQYVLRALRPDGFVYVYFENQLECFQVDGKGNLTPERYDSGKPKARPDRKGRNIVPIQDCLTFPSDAKEVVLAFSDHRWAEAERSRVSEELKNNPNGSTTMQRFSLDTKKQQKNAFPIGELGKQVEEYAGRYPDYVPWNEYNFECGTNFRVDVRIEQLKKAAQKGQFVVALYDPFGTAFDLSKLVHKELVAMQGYAKENERQKIVSDLIERVYVGIYRAKTNKKGSAYDAALVSEALESDEIDDYKEHIKEKERNDFAIRFNEGIKRFEGRLQEKQLDRFEWVKTLEDGDKQTKTRANTLKADYERYKMAVPESWCQYEFAFARATAGMCASPLPGEIMRKEFDLIKKWLETDKSPIYTAIMGQTDLLGAVTGNWDRDGDTFSGSAQAVTQMYAFIYKKFPVTAATLQIEQIVKSYIVTVTSDVMKTKTPADIDKELSKALHEAFKKCRSFHQAIHVAAAREGHFNVQVKEQSTLRAVTEIADKSGMKKILKTYQRRWGERSKTSSRKTTDFKKTSTYAEWTTKEMRATKIGEKKTEWTDLDPRTKTNPNEMVNRRVNGSWMPSAVGGIVGILNIMNLWSAVASVCDEDAKWEEITNVISAAAGISSSFAGLGESVLKKVKSPAQLRALNASTRLGRLTRGITSGALAKALGLVGAFFSVVTDLLKAYEQYKEGESDAVVWYTASAASAVAGTICFLIGGPFVWVAVIAVGLSIWFVGKADASKAGPIEKWLDACFFGYHNRMFVYKDADTEREGFIAAVEAPQIFTSIDDRDTFAYTEVFVAFPGYEPGKSKAELFFSGRTTTGKLLPGNKKEGELLHGETCVFKYKIPYVRYAHGAVNPGYPDGTITYDAVYQPDKDEDKTYHIYETIGKKCSLA